jgi:SNF2 family DNA or RNA helicase
LIPQEWDILYDEKIKEMKPKKSTVSFDFDISSENNGLLEFSLGFHCDNLKINEKELLEYIMSNKKLLFYEGRFIEVANREKLLSLLKLIGTFGESENGAYSDKLYRISELMPYLKNDSIKDQKDRIIKLIDEAQNKKPLDDVVIHGRFQDVLRNYQRDGVLWMHFLRKYSFGGILADDMGLGKTLQSLVMISSFSKDRPSLVICPKTLIYNWAEETEKFVPDMPIKVIEGSQSVRRHMIKNISNGGLIVTSYPLLQKDIDEYVKIRFEYCIIDEAQKIKNPDTLTAKCVKLIDSEYRLALTGTPLENNLTDLWSVFDFAMPGFLGNESSFKNRFVNLAEEQGYDSLNELKTMIRPFILRRTKSEMLKELPPKIEQACYARLTKAQLTLYMDMLEKIRSEIYLTVSENGFERSQIKILAGLTRLRQICNHPGLISQGHLSKKDISGKMELFTELIEECTQGGHRVLVFSQFVKMLDILQRYMEETETSFVRLDGSTKDRRAVIEKFSKEEDIKIFLISLKAGGLGLNLTSADTVILCDPWWNPMTEEQAMDRAYRIGQKNTVNVYKLITKGTIEEKIQAMQLRKKQLFNSVISESGEYMKKMTWDDVKEILSSC